MSFSTATVQIGQSTKKSNFDQLLNNTRYLASGTNTVFVGGKTFKSVTTFSGKSTFTATAIFSVMPRVNKLNTISATNSLSIAAVKKSMRSGSYNFQIKHKIFAIGAWNMSGTQQVTVDISPLSYANVISVQAFVRTDGGNNNYIYPIDKCYNSGSFTSIGGSIGVVADSLVYLQRNLNGAFRNSAFNSSGTFNRGWVDVLYTDDNINNNI